MLREKLLVLGDQIRTIDLHPTEAGVLIGLVESNVRRGGRSALRSNCNLSSRCCAAGRCALSGTCNCSRTARAEAVGSQLWLSEDWERKQAAARQRRTEQVA